MSSSAPYDLGAMVTCTPGVYGGRPCLAGTRYPVMQVGVQWREGMIPEEIAGEFGLKLELVYAGVAYYLANRAAIDAEIEAEDQEYWGGVEQSRAARAGTTA